VNERPAFSVLMPAHRADDHLIAALRSLVPAFQGHAAELVVVANGPDRAQVAQRVRAHAVPACLRVELSELPSLAYCLNRGLELARGEYIARFDADDLCLPDRFAVQLATARSTGADFVFGAAHDVDAAGMATGRTRQSTTQLWNRCGPVHPTAFVRRSALLALGGYGQLDASEDYHLWLRASASGCSLHADPHAVIAYRVHELQATSRQRLADTFACNAGMKLTQALREGSPALLAGALLDLGRYGWRRCANAFS
jgi:glycosyltransferase involved in cell wall biosynthesis